MLFGSILIYPFLTQNSNFSPSIGNNVYALKTGVLLERAMRRKCSWNTCCVKMLNDVVIEKCSWHWKIFIGTVLGQCVVHSPLEKHKMLAMRLPSILMPAAQILGSLNCPDCDSSLILDCRQIEKYVYHRVSGKSQPVQYRIFR